MTFPSESDIEARMHTIAEHVRQENRHNLDGIMSTFGHEGRYEDLGWGDHREGLDGVRAYYRDLLHALPDLHIAIEGRHVAGETIILEVRITGTHKGAWRGLPATGNTVDFPLCSVFSFDAENNLAGERIYYDRAAVLRQLGAYREPTSPMGRIATVLGHPVTLARALLRRHS